jgi:hypothetical protein
MQGLTSSCQRTTFMPHIALIAFRASSVQCGVNPWALPPPAGRWSCGCRLVVYYGLRIDHSGSRTGIHTRRRLWLIVVSRRNSRWIRSRIYWSCRLMGCSGDREQGHTHQRLMEPYRLWRRVASLRVVTSRLQWRNVDDCWAGAGCCSRRSKTARLVSVYRPVNTQTGNGYHYRTRNDRNNNKRNSTPVTHVTLIFD